MNTDEKGHVPAEEDEGTFPKTGPGGAEQEVIPGTTWGPLATTGFGILVWAVFLAVQLFVAGWFVAAEVAGDPEKDLDAIAGGLDQNGLLVSLATLATAVVCSSLVLLLVKLRKGASVRQYLCTVPVPFRVLFRWLGYTALFILVSDTLTHLLGKPIVHTFMIQAYRTAVFAPLFWVAIVFAAPLFEEIFFRGFLFQGFRYSRLGTAGAVLITSFAWAVIHSQYGVYEHVTIFFGGVLLALARVATGSLYTATAMHALFNLVAVVQVVVCVHTGSCVG